MSRKAIIAISAIVLIYSIYINNQDGETPDWNFLNSSSEVEEEKEALPVFDNFPQPENGFSPYNDYFGRGVYNNDTGNEFVIKNSNSKTFFHITLELLAEHCELYEPHDFHSHSN